MNVKFYDPKTKQVTEMPADELAPGCVKVKITGMEDEYFMSADAVKAGEEFRHPPFEGKLKAMMADFEEPFHEVMPMSAQKWKEGFRKDHNAEPEIATWLFVALDTRR